MTSVGLPPIGKSAPSVASRVAAALASLEEGHEPAPADRAAIWHWDLASGKVEWDERLHERFGYVELITDAAWRESRIHPDDRPRVTVSLQRATILNHGTLWSEQYRFRHANGSYVSVTERACVVDDTAGPHWVLGGLRPASPA